MSVFNLGLWNVTFRKFLNSDIPPEVQYFSWAPVGDKLVKLHRGTTRFRGALTVALSDRALCPQAYVWSNNLYVKINRATPPKAVTDTGEDNVILNGIPDWVYEGESGVRL